MTYCECCKPVKDPCLGLMNDCGNKANLVYCMDQCQSYKRYAKYLEILKGNYCPNCGRSMKSKEEK